MHKGINYIDSIKGKTRMFLADQWHDYEVLDSGDGEKLERWGSIILRRPDPQVIWPVRNPEIWKNAHAY